MPKRIDLKRNIPALMCRNQYESMLITWVQATLNLFPNYQVTNAVADFLKFYQIPESFWSPHTATQFAYQTLGECNDMKFNCLTKIISDYEKRQSCD